tara:strand:+ start:294 stop:731 length:438 start_codon:yes stop_codon:yes gene_type:complete
MKKIGQYTARGQIANQTTKRITLFDGRFDTGYKVVSFKVFPDEPYTAAADVVGVLATEEAAATDDWDLNDQRQIAWSSVDIRTGGFAAGGGDVDPDNFIVEDLYFHGKNGDGGAINYLIVMEKYETSEWMGALAMVRNSAQDIGS